MVGETKGGTVNIDLSKVPRSNGVFLKEGNNTYHYFILSLEVIITVEGHKTENIKYKKLVYKLQSGATARDIKYKEETGLPKEVNQDTIYVYYWEGDAGYSTPLLIQIGDNTNEGYSYNSTKRTWEKDPNASRLDRTLEQQNCKRNKAHKLELINDSGSATCEFCGNRFNITPERGNEGTHNYTRYKFVPQKPGEFQYIYFTHGRNIQEGLPYPKNIQNIYVFWKTRPSKNPYIIYYNFQGANIWYRLTGQQNKWDRISTNIVTNVVEDDSDIIKTLMTGTHPPTITIDVSRVHNGLEEFTSYEDPGGHEPKVHIKVSKEGEDEEPTDYIQFLHRGVNESPFTLREIRHGQIPLNGIDINGVFTSVTAHYAKSDRGHRTPLLIELVSGGKTAKYMYFHKAEKTAQWALYSSQGSELKGQSLKEKLNGLKDIHLSGSTYGARIGGQEGQENQGGDQSFNYTALWSSLVAFGAVGVIGVVVYKFWPTIKRAF